MVGLYKGRIDREKKESESLPVKEQQMKRRSKVKTCKKKEKEASEQHPKNPELRKRIEKHHRKVESSAATHLFEEKKREKIETKPPLKPSKGWIYRERKDSIFVWKLKTNEMRKRKKGRKMRWEMKLGGWCGEAK